MICFPNAKINLGIQVARKRSDGFHNLRSVHYPIPFYDVLEFKEADKYSLTVWGNSSKTLSENNLITKAWKLLSTRYNIPAVEVHLLKNIPVGSGLGGGSSDAIFFVKNILEWLKIEMSEKELISLAEELCSDCPFFVYNRPAYVFGKGNFIEPLEFDLHGYWLALILPDTPVSTEDAFEKIIPKHPQYNLKQLVIKKDINNWKEQLFNDFEKVLPPHLTEVKRTLYKAGALYASLTGSGSAFYGIFDKKPDILTDERTKLKVVGF